MNTPHLQCIRLFLKRLDFESFLPRDGHVDKPDVTVRLHVDTVVHDEEQHVTLTASVVMRKNAEDSAPLLRIEAAQTGVFVITGSDKQHTAQLLHGKCADLLFPYVRELIANITGRSGLPSLLLDPVDFQHLAATKTHAQPAETIATPDKDDDDIH